MIGEPDCFRARSELQTAQKRLALAKTTYEREKAVGAKVSAEQDYLQAKQAVEQKQRSAVANAKN